MSFLTELLGEIAELLLEKVFSRALVYARARAEEKERNKETSEKENDNGISDRSARRNR